MLEQPQLLIIAGPNGAGKSTLSKTFAPNGAFIFDPDKESAKIEKQYPDLPSESIHYALNQYFLDCVHQAIKGKADFVLETNFRDHSLMDTVIRFQNNGYAANMIYLAISGIPQSMDRVKKRVKSGGHFVDNESIRFNYTEGLKNLQYFADRFDNLEVLLTSKNPSDIRSLLSIQQKQLVFLADDLPGWMEHEISYIANHFRDISREQDDGEEWNWSRGPGR
ncbi:MAG: zeta toxin family protein [Mucilaginibacter sp.]|nr:zeta toxin family protein [Mucilaginibacter sp.]